MTGSISRPADASASDPMLRAPAAVLVLLIGTFMATLDFFIVNVAIPDLQHDLQASDADVELIVAGYAVAYGSALIVGSRLGDSFGRKRMFLLGVSLFTLSSVICGVTPTAAILVAARLVQGLAAALLSPQVLAVFGAELGPAAKAHALVAYGFAMGIASVFVQLFGGLLIRLDPFATGWRACFLINLPVGLLAIALVAPLTPESRSSRPPRLDLCGMLLIVAVLGPLLLALVQGRQSGWPRWSVMLLADAAVAFVAFVRWEAHVKRGGGTPLVDFVLFRERSFTVGLIAQVAFFMSMAGFYLVLALYLQEGRGLTPLGAGIIFVANGAGYLCTSSQVSRLRERLDHQLIALAAALRVVGLAILLATVAMIGTAGSSLCLIPGLLLNGAGTGFAVSPLASTVLSRVSAGQVGAASGMLTTGLQVGNAIGVAVISIIFFAVLRQAGRGYGPAFVAALVYLIAMNLVLIGLVQLLRPQRHDRRARAAT